MRKALLVRVRPLVERFANQLTEIVIARMEAELARVNDSLEVALSAYQSDAVPDVLTAALGPELAAMLNTQADASRALRLARQLDIEQRDTKPKLDKNVHSPVPRGNPPDLHRDIKPENIPPRAEPQSQVKTCSKCGFVGGNARGCGTAHVTQQVQPDVLEPLPEGVAAAHALTKAEVGEALRVGGEERKRAESRASMVRSTGAPMTAIAPERRLSPTPAALAAARARIARISTRAKTTPPSARKPEPATEVDDNENADERWSPQRTAEERELAENRKHEGELPEPRSSFRVTPSRGGYDTHGDLGDVQELDFGASD